MRKLLLDGSWLMKDTRDSEWLPAEVPGSVLANLLKQGKIEDPFYRDNEDRIRELGRNDYAFMREFDVDEELLGSDELVLRCEGLDTLATVTVNGIQVGLADNMHRIYEFDVKSCLKAGKNAIHILFASPIRFIEEKHAVQQLWGIDPTIAGYPHLRKAHSMFGWDWGPQLPDAGIWRSISIRGYASGRLDDVHVLQHHEDGSVELEIRVAAKLWTEEAEARVAVTASNGEVSEASAHVTRANGSAIVRMTIDRPELWWPNGYGEQPLYRVEVDLLVEGRAADRQEFNIGLRRIRLNREKDQWGESFEIEVNGVSIFAQGGNYIPEDSLFTRRTPEKAERLIRDCVRANFNCIRVWGGGHYPDDCFYELCDRYGLVVWQDFMFACGVYEMNEAFTENVCREAEDNIKRLRHHASLGLWCGNNEMEWGWHSWGFPKTDELRAHYLKQFEEVLPQAVREFDPQTAYWPASPSSGGGFDEPNDENRGDVHYWEVWHGQKPFTEYRKYHFRFCSEFGFQSFPSLKTVESYTEPADRNIFSYVMEKHQKDSGANGKILYYLSKTLQYPKDLDSLLYASQLLQAEAIKYGVEHWRRNRGRCMGSLYWQVNDCWPVASWASIDYYGRWKALHYFAKRFYAPVLLSACEEDTSVSLHLTNETRETVKGTVRWRLCDNLSTVICEGEAAAEVPALTAASCVTLDFSDRIHADNLRNVYLAYSFMAEGETESEGTVLFTPPKHFEFLPPQLSVELRDAGEVVEFHVRSAAYAKYVELSFDQIDAIFSDNYFDLSAGTAKIVFVEKSSLPEAITVEELQTMIKARSVFDISN